MGEGGRDAFGRAGTIGIEEEFYIVDEAGRPTSGTDELCYERAPPAILEDRLDHELFKCVIETQTPIIEDLDAAPEVLAEVREALVEHATDAGYRIASAGLHPLARWRELEHVTKPRYRRQLERIQYPQHRNTTAGLHVHVGVDDGEAAVWIANEIRWYLPLVLALSANSPFWNGFDTGLASARAKIFEGLPNTGMPPTYPDLATYRDLETLLLETDAINDRGEIWFDVRPHTEYGTVEVRTPDAQRDETVVLAFVEYVTKLVDRLGQAYSATREGTQLSALPDALHAPWASPNEAPRPAADRPELLMENKWRACRYGHDAALIARDGSTQIDVETATHEEIDRLGLTRLESVLDAPSGAERQRAIHEADGVDALAESLIVRPGES